MNAALLPAGPAAAPPPRPAGNAATEADAAVLTVVIAGTHCGIPVGVVRDVLTVSAITRVPLSPPEVAGSLNLRGRIVTVIDLRRRLGFPDRDQQRAPMSVAVEREGELYSLLVDEVGDVVTLPAEAQVAKPPTLDPTWRGVTHAVCRHNNELVILLDVERLLAIG